MKPLAILALILLVLPAPARPADLTSSGNWLENIDATDLTGGAGTGLISTYESTANATQLNVANSVSTWRLYVRRSDVSWSSSVRLFIRRTSSGTGSGEVTGSLSYIEVTSLDTEICSGTGDRSGVGFQYQLTGMSVAVSPASYSSSIIFTVIE